MISRFLLFFLSGKRKDMPIDEIAHILAVKKLKKISRLYRINQNFFQISDLGYFLPEFNSYNLLSLSDLDKKRFAFKNNYVFYSLTVE
ncbi:MAG: hypothetical protein KatS3mg088_465 [Patescibacteria group bacterium]|nr:MAG: hypothetical protein KatS3mg088_465 [Patescibacteria group bacterium]